MSRFEKVNVDRIPCKNNGQVDTLSNVASSAIPQLIDQIYVDIGGTKHWSGRGYNRRANTSELDETNLPTP